ncbi:MAG: hypothetical protein A4E40_00952 [Methanoregulaceae archaeon PtaU1.Bin059]|nr:MAG: hypothetical protein A4E39_01578 [Methanoregulaceae archaeon PtaB.Bin152]OPY39957.1 MAG: hypothetical protein A4E40_00952 [Methanoregulaceae archaeon PtaU1.Bin059]
MVFNLKIYIIGLPFLSLMRKNTYVVVALLLGVAFLMVPAAAAFHSPIKSTMPQISAPRIYLSGFDVKDPSTFNQFQVQINAMNLTPPPIPQMSLKSIDGKWDYNWGSDRFTPGGHWL